MAMREIRGFILLTAACSASAVLNPTAESHVSMAEALEHLKATTARVVGMGMGPQNQQVEKPITLKARQSPYNVVPGLGGFRDDTTDQPKNGLRDWEGVSFRGTEHPVKTAVDRDFILASAGSIAAYRAAVTAYNSSYLEDTYARIFARHVCKDRLDELLQKPPEKLARFAVRTRFFDAFVRDAIHNRGIQQVVIVGAGFDARALRSRDMRFLDVPDQPKNLQKTMFEMSLRLTFYEIDLPELMEAKRDILASVDGTEEEDKEEDTFDDKSPAVARIGVDVMQEDWLGSLRLAGFNAHKPACFVLEGFLYYFDEASVNRTVEAISSWAVGGSRIAISGVSKSATIGQGSAGRFVWGTDAPEDYIESFGWEAAEARQFGDPSIAFGFPMEQEVIDNWKKPRSDVGAKRTWYITATRKYPPKNRVERIKDWIGRQRDRFQPWIEKAAPWVIKIATGGLEIKIPLPKWLQDV